MAHPVLVDTSVWIRHFKKSDPLLCNLLETGRVVTHEFILEELMIGGLGNKSQHLHLLQLLTKFQKVSHKEVVQFINMYARPRRFKIGLVDCYLLTSALVHELFVYSDDAGLARAAKASGCGLERE